MEFINPSSLISGKSTVGLIAPSGVVDKKGLAQGVALLESWGFKTRLGEHVFDQVKDYSAGGGKERVNDLLSMIEDDEIGAIGCIVGGYAATGILKYFTPEVCGLLKKKPKVFFGYSDFSLILNVLFSNGIVSYHAPNVGGLSERSLNSQKSLRLALLGECPAEINPWFDWKPIVNGKAEGRFLVTNLEALIDLTGTEFDPLAKINEDLILALEDVGVSKSVLTRWLHTLAVHTHSKKIKGMVLGRFVKIGEKDYPIWGEEMGVEQIFLEAFGERGIPLASWPEFGHIEEEKVRLLPFTKRKGRERVEFWSLPSGVRTMLEVREDFCRLKFLEKPLL